MARYGKKASQKVEKTMRERKKGTFEEWLRQEGQEQKAGDRDRACPSPARRRQSSS